MSNKNMLVTQYIAKLKPGERVSVRSLAKELNVSEGTAYRSIKTAEAQGLVTTRPKTGTVRVNLRGATGNSVMSIAEAANSIGAVFLCGAESALSRPVPPIIVADGSAQQLKGQLARTSGTVLCLVGDRPELFNAAVEKHADILLTLGTKPEACSLEKAERAGCCVFVSEQDSFTVLGMLARRAPAELPRRDMSEVRDWMQLPKYLYRDDSVRDWFRQYGDYFTDSSKCAIVDDHLRICGSLDAVDAAAASPEKQIAELMEGAEGCVTVEEKQSMEQAAEQLVRRRRMFAPVVNNDGMSGLVSVYDVIRYYRYMPENRQLSGTGGRLELTNEDGDARQRMYTLYLGSRTRNADRSRYIGFVLSAAARHAFELLERPVSIENGTFYAPTPVTDKGEYMISSDVMRRSDRDVTLELELFDEASVYFKCSVTMSAQS